MLGQQCQFQLSNRRSIEHVVASYLGQRLDSHLLPTASVHVRKDRVRNRGQPNGIDSIAPTSLCLCRHEPVNSKPRWFSVVQGCRDESSGKMTHLAERSSTDELASRVASVKVSPPAQVLVRAGAISLSLCRALRQGGQ